MNKNMVIGIIVGVVGLMTIICALGAIYDYVPSVARVIWPNSIRHREIKLHNDNIFDEDIIGNVPVWELDKVHVCELWDGEPTMVSGWFKYNFELDTWIYCQ